MSEISALASDHLDIWAAGTERPNGAGRGGGKRVNFYGIERLRELILDLAVRGKLVPQDANDEPAVTLLDELKAERSKLIKAGLIGKGKHYPTVSNEPPFEIPAGWTWTQISEIGHDWGQRQPVGDFTYIDVGSIDQRAGVVRAPSILAAQDAPSRARKVVRKGTVIYSTVRPYLLNIATVDQDYNPEPIASTAFAIIHPLTGVEAGFIYHYLRSPAFVRYVESCQTGIAYPAINDRQFFAAWCPLPPTAEQARIVAKVDELMALCDALEGESASALTAHHTLAETLLATLLSSADAAVLAANWTRLETHFDTLFTTLASVEALERTILELAVRGRLVANAGHAWPTFKLEHLIGPMDSGWSPACMETPAPTEDAWGVLKTTAVQRLTYDETQNKELPAGLTPRPAAECRAGDILFTRAGPMNRVGICCFVESTRPRLMISDKIIRFRPVSEDVNGAFLALALSVGPAAKQIEEAKSGMASSQVNVSQAKLRAVTIAVPSSEIQRTTIERVGVLMSLCDLLKAHIEEAGLAQKRLADAIIERAAA